MNRKKNYTHKPKLFNYSLETSNYGQKNNDQLLSIGHTNTYMDKIDKIEENKNTIQTIKKNGDIFDKEIDEKDIKKESNDDEDDILSEEVDEMEESGKILFIRYRQR